MLNFTTDFGGLTYDQFRFNLITKFEGFSSTAYVDTAGHPTIGYGFDLRDPNIFTAVADADNGFLQKY